MSLGTHTDVQKNRKEETARWKEKPHVERELLNQMNDPCLVDSNIHLHKDAHMNWIQLQASSCA